MENGFADETVGGPARPVILFVLGMGRSGTSALTRVLSLCGATLPVGMLGADKGNPRGYWEPRAALHLNERFLYRHGSTFFDPTMRVQDEDGVRDDERAEFVTRIERYLRTLPKAPVVLIKDLHVSVLSGMWFEAARRAGFDVAAVIALRHPREVSGSLAKLIGASPELSAALWLKYNLLAEMGTRDVPRVYVEYSRFLEDWRREIRRVSALLPIELDAAAGVDEFLEPDLRREPVGDGLREPFGTDWISMTYEALQAAARDERWDPAELDRVYKEFSAGERGFRVAFDDFQEAFGNRVFRFSRRFLGPLFEGVAIAHGRRGTWA